MFFDQEPCSALNPMAFVIKHWAVLSLSSPRNLISEHTLPPQPKYTPFLIVSPWANKTSLSVLTGNNIELLKAFGES